MRRLENILKILHITSFFASYRNWTQKKTNSETWIHRIQGWLETFKSAIIRLKRFKTVCELKTQLNSLRYHKNYSENDAELS